MDNNEKKGISRRSFLMGIPVGIAGVVAFNAIGNRVMKRNASQYPKFPEGSIFTPANDRTEV
ncbi:MAG: hypothetical protein OXD31_09830 [Chloroflexi bacterium]|nr:hypothetical protein [Chloroflexota bacterium]